MNDFEFEEDSDTKKYVISIDQLKFEEVIGIGGFGEVSTGYYLPTGQKVAIKKLHNLKNSKRSIELYKREIVSHATLQHRFLVPFIGFTDKPPFCIVTKYMENGSLYKVLHCSDGKIKLNSTQLNIIAYGISLGMQYLHSHSIIHRDLKTQNILLDENFLPVIADFGSSRKIATEETMTGLFGTSNYMAPEFIHCEEYDEKVDVYSFGLILWELLTGSVPFDGLEMAQVIFLVVMRQSRPEIPENAPPNLAKLIECCWSHNPNDRPTFDKIVPLFENGTVEFPMCDRAVFNQFVKSVSCSNTLKVSRRHSNANLLAQTDEDMVNIPMARDTPNFHSVQALYNSKNYVHNLVPKSNEFLFALNSNNPIRIRQSLNFFEGMINNPNIKTLAVWPQFLLFLCTSNQPKELIKKGENICIQFSRRYEILKGISQVADLEKYVKPNTLDIFLYVINYMLNSVDIKSIVNSLFALFTDINCSKKAITLVCKIVQNSPSPTITKTILNRFKSECIKYVNVSGGNLIVRTIVFFDSVDEKIISAFGESKIDENVASAYQALFATGTNPSVFSLDSVLKHLLSEDESLREMSLEYVLRFCKNVADETLKKITVALFEQAIKYESEKAVLLLARIANNRRSPGIIYQAFEVDKWLKTSPKVSVNMLKLFIVSMKTDNRVKEFLFGRPNVFVFFTNLLKSQNEEAIVSACWALSKNRMTKEFAQNLSSAGFLSELCDLLNRDKEEDPKRYVHFLNIITMMAEYVYHDKFVLVCERLLNMIKNGSSIAYYCIISLASISKYPQTHCEILNNNVAAIFRGYKDNGESKKYQQKIYDNIRKGGFLNYI